MFQALLDWSNLLHAADHAARGKRAHPAVAAFEHRRADRLLELQAALEARQWQPGAFRHFHVHEPKRRRISAAPFEDRVLHHALVQVIAPPIEARFIAHSYANRRGKGTHRALNQLQLWMRRYRYALRCDVVQHFASLDHRLLRAKLQRRVPDEDVMHVVDLLLAGGAGALADEYTMRYFPGDDLFAAMRPRGLPIGNLTSQFWSNVYLNDFDWFVTRELGCGAYLRYVDDFVLLGDSHHTLQRLRGAVIERLARDRLVLHEAQAEVVPVTQGLPWLGFVVFPTHRRLKRRNAVDFTRRLRALRRELERGEISFAEFDASVQGWINHARHADTWGLREHLFAANPIRFPAG